MYFKSTDMHALLHKRSHRDAHICRGIVKAQLMRFRRICSRKEDWKEAKGVLFKALRERGYSRRILGVVA